MNIQLNGQPLNVEGITSQTTLGELFEILHGFLQEKGLTLMEVILNGKSYDPDDLIDVEKKCVESFPSIEILGSTVKDLVQQAVEDSDEALAHMETIGMDISNNLRLGKVQEAMEKHVEFLDCMDWLTTVLERLEKAFASNMQESAIEGRRSNLVRKLGEQMGMIRAAQESQDWIGMADILEYEFFDLFKESKELLKAVRI